MKEWGSKAGKAVRVSGAGSHRLTVDWSWINERPLIREACESCLAGLVVTTVFVPDVTALSLKENDVRWEKLLAAEDYDGAAVERELLLRSLGLFFFFFFFFEIITWQTLGTSRVT